MNPTPLLMALCAAIFLNACERPSAPAERHDDHAATPQEHHDDAGEKLTHLDEKSELFLEFPPLIVGQTANFAAHLTWLADFKPFTQGRLTVVLAGGAAPEERFVVEAPAVPGIFKPSVSPKTAGERRLSLQVETAQGALTHELGTVTVFVDSKAAQKNHDTHDENDKGIPFSKEQQWKADFAVVPAIKGVARPSVTATATLKARPDGEAMLMAPTAGIVRALNFPRIGQTVKQGQIVATFAPRLGSDTDQATLDAAVGKARIALAQAQRERERMESLFKAEAVAEKRLLDARAGEGMAQADYAAAQQRAGQLGGGANGIALRAPIDGTIADVAVSAGAFVAEGAPLLHIAQTERLWLEARVAESDILRLGQPSAVALRVPGSDTPLMVELGKAGRLIAIGNVVDAATRTVPVVFEFANPERKLRLGMSANVQIFSAGGTETVLVPASAVQDESGAQAVYVQLGGESFKRQLVRTGARDGESVAIVDGLQAGQRVVSRGAYLIRLSMSKSGPSGHAH